MNKKVSVIVPIYNVEKYLRKCVDSIIGQTYINLEIILVNDGSTDHCLDICNEYKKLDDRVIVLNKVNGGLSSARNAGVKVAGGDYWTFVDSDDYLDNNAIFVMVNLLSNGSDIAYLHETFVDEDYNPCSEDIKEHKVVHYKSYDFLQLMCERKINCSVCGRMFKQELFSNVSFNESRLNEDFLLLSEMLLGKEAEIAEDNYCGYYYLQRSKSISRNGFGKSSRDAVYNTEEMKKLAQKKEPSLVPYFGSYAAYQARTALIIMTPSQYEDDSSFVFDCKQIIQENLEYIWKPVLPFKDKIFCMMYCRLPRITIGMVRFTRGLK